MPESLQHGFVSLETTMRFLMLLSLALWLGSIFFFALMAPTVFAVLPSRELAGQLINPLLYKLHWIGTVCGVLFLGASMVWNRLRTGNFRTFAGSHILVVAMLGLLAISQFAVVPRMCALRAQMGGIDAVSQDDSRRIQFNELHQWSTRLEGSVFLLGLVALYLAGRQRPHRLS